MTTTSSILNLPKRVECKAYAYGTSKTVATLLGEFVADILNETINTKNMSDKKTRKKSKKRKRAKWYVTLVESVNTMAEELGLSDHATAKLRDFVITKAKEQYMAGNRSGIRWMRKQMNKKNGAKA